MAKIALLHTSSIMSEASASAVATATPIAAMPTGYSGRINHTNQRPTLDQLKGELAREKHKKISNRILRNAIWTLVVVAAATILAATLALPVLQISGTSMSPTLAEGQIVVALKGSGYTTGDVVAINYGSRVLVKRIIAGPGQWVNITSDGTVYVDGVAIDEDYITDKSLGKCDITLPYQVPDDSWFVMGDHRETSVDSRSASVGSIASGDIVGKIILRVWPFNTLGRV